MLCRLFFTPRSRSILFVSSVLIIAPLSAGRASADNEYEFGQSAILEPASSIESKLACVGRFAVSLNRSPLESAYAELEIRDRYFNQMADREFGSDQELVSHIGQLLRELWSRATDDDQTEKLVAESLGTICNEHDAYFIAGLHNFVRRWYIAKNWPRKHFEEGIFDSSGCKARWESLMNRNISKTCEAFGDWTFTNSIDREAWRPISFTPWVREEAERAQRSFKVSELTDTAPIQTYAILRLDVLALTSNYDSFLSDSLHAYVQRLADEDSKVRELAQSQILWLLVSATDKVELFSYRQALREFRDSDQYRTDTVVRGHIDAILSSPVSGNSTWPVTVMDHLMTQRSCYPFSSRDLIVEMLPSVCGFSGDAKGVAMAVSADTNTEAVGVNSYEPEVSHVEPEPESEPAVPHNNISPL